MSNPDNSENQPNAEKASAGANYAVPIVVGLLLVFMGAQLALKYRPRAEEKPASTTTANVVRPMGYAPNVPGTPASPPLSESEQATIYINQGTELLATGKVDQALAKFQLALKLTPEDEDIHYALGIAFARLGKTAEAVHH